MTQARHAHTRHAHTRAPARRLNHAAHLARPTHQHAPLGPRTLAGVGKEVNRLRKTLGASEPLLKRAQALYQRSIED